MTSSTPFATNFEFDLGSEEPAAELCEVPPPAPAPPPLQAPQSSSSSSSDFVKIGLLSSQGAFAHVYLVRHQDGRRLAYKQITCKKDPNVEPANCAATIQEARAEAALHASLDHPNVVKIEEFFWGAELGMFMEFCKGGSLKSKLDACRKRRSVEQPLAHWPARLELLRQAARGVSYLHSLADGAVLHNDLRADNLLLQVGDDGSHTLKLADFGLAYKVPADARLDGSGCVQVPSHHVTHPRWVAPEVMAHASGDEVMLSKATDVYSMAAVMVEALTAREPHFTWNDEYLEMNPGLGRLPDVVDTLCTWALQEAAKEGKPRLLRFPEPSARLPCPKGGVECAEPLRGVFEACCDVRITTDQQGQPKVAPPPQQRRPSADELSAALASWPECSLGCA